MNILITFLAGGIIGTLFFKRKIPGGMMIGAVCGTVMLSLFYSSTEMPYIAKLAAQITAGAFLACSVDKKYLAYLRHVHRPVLLVLGTFVLLNLSLGVLLHYVCAMDPLTALLSTVPGGVSQLSLVAADMGADVSQVVVLQFVRMCAGIGFFPSWIAWLSGRGASAGQPALAGQVSPAGEGKEEEKADYSLKGTAICLLTASLCGGAGSLAGIPAGGLICSMTGVLLIKLFVFPVSLPRWIKRFAQILSGTYIGCSIGRESLLGLRYVIFPAVLILAAYMLNSVFVGKLLVRQFSIPLKEAMLMTTPAGAGDMVLISADIGVQSPALVVVQIMRVLTATSLMPQIALFAARLMSHI